MKEVSLSWAYRLLHPKLTVLISSGNGTENVMSAAWVIPVSVHPPLVAVAISPKRYTYELILSSKEFAINVPSVNMLDIVDYCGSVSGRDVNKVASLGLTTLKPKVIKSPLIKGCAGFLECKFKEAFKAGDHFLVVGEVVRACSEDLFDEIYDVNKFKPLIHLGGDNYCTISSNIFKPKV